VATEQAGVQQNVEFENEQVRVVRFRFGPHAKIPMHDAPDVIAVALTEGHLRLTFPDGAIQDLRYRPGEASWAPAQRHAGENVGDTPFEFIALQLKRNVA
jgi:quercetin dioxygenase-like cupin family protein